jgi:hypothetical protein
MRVAVPTSVDVHSLLSGYNLSKTKYDNLKNRIYYILSRIVIHNDNVDLYKKTNYYRLVSSYTMKKILGNCYYYQALGILMNPQDPVIVCNESYQTDKYPQGYRIHDNYHTGEVEFKTLLDDSKLVKRIKKYQPNYKDMIEITEKYDFLINQFDNHILSVDQGVYGYIRNMYNSIIGRVEKDNQYQLKAIHNIIGRWLYNISKINEGNCHPTISGKNHRLNSAFTQLPKILRPWILCDGKPLVGVDVKASQPYLLSSIMEEEYYITKEQGFNLYTINPNMYRKLIERNIIKDLWYYKEIQNPNCYFINNSNYIQLFINNKKRKYTSVMWCEFFAQDEIQNISSYQNIPFQKDYYSHVLLNSSNRSWTNEELEIERTQFKKSMMYFLFEDDMKKRRENPRIEYMRKYYPGVNKWIEMVLEHIGGKEFSYVLQRSESYLLLDKVSRKFNQENSEAPIFTIHDGLYTFDEYVNPLKDLITSIGIELTNFLPGVKIERLKIDLNPPVKDVDKYWKKVKWINNKGRFDKKKHRIFQSNIDRAKLFLKNSVI